MDDSDEIAPEVRSILAAAREREGGGERLSVEARSLSGALAAAEAEGRVPIIAEVKPTSPTTAGRRDGDPVDLARGMVEGGAAALSVLTEPEHFGGSPDALRRVREAVDVPVLRKDFLLCEDHLDAVAADAVLLIARFVDDLPGLLAAARERGFHALVEVHTREELRRAVAAGADVVGVNNRDLARLEVDLGTFERVAPHARRLCRREQSSSAERSSADRSSGRSPREDGEAARQAPEGVTLVAESGIATPADVRRMRAAGADGLLVGSAIMDGDVTENTRRLAGATGARP